MSEDRKHARGGVFGGWYAVGTRDGRVLWRQHRPTSVAGADGIEAAGPYSRRIGVPGLSERIRQSPVLSQSMPRDPSDRERQFLEEIGQHEGASYNSAFGMRKDGKSLFTTPRQHSGKDLTEMTIDEVFAYQKALREQTKAKGYGRSNGKVVGTSAVGRGQFVEKTLRGNLIDAGITDFARTKFTPELQDMLILRNARHSGVDPNQADRWGPSEKEKLAGQWESLDVGKGKIGEADLDRVIGRIAALSPEGPPKPIGKRSLLGPRHPAQPMQPQRTRSSRSLWDYFKW